MIIKLLGRMMNLNYVLYALKYYLCTKYYALPVLMTHPDYIHVYSKIPSFYVKKVITVYTLNLHL